MNWPIQPTPMVLTEYPPALAEWRDTDTKHREVYRTSFGVRVVWRLPEMGPVYGWLLADLLPDELTSGQALADSLVARIRQESLAALSTAETAMAATADEWLAKRREAKAVTEWMRRLTPSQKATT